MKDDNIFEGLERIYRVQEDLEKLNMQLTQEQLDLMAQLEESVIKEKVLPVLAQDIEPTLSKIKRPLVLVVDYIPGQPLSVHLSRKHNFAAEIPDAKEIVLDPEVEHGSRTMKTEEKFTHAPASDLVITFPDGSVIAEKKASDTLVSAIKKIGVARVRKVVEEEGLVFCKVPVISNRRDTKYGKTQKDLGDGWLVITHSNNKMKKHFL